MRLDRRELLRLSMMGGGALALGPAFWKEAYAAPAQPGPSPYGAMSGSPDVNGVRLPAGFTSRIVARSGRLVGNTNYTWPGAPDGGACFPVSTGGWVYVANSELGSGTGGASAIRFDGGGAIVGAYRILGNTHRNCAGGPTPWGSWLTCEETVEGTGPAGRARDHGYIFEVPAAAEEQVPAVPLKAMGRFVHEAVAVDPRTGIVYETEDRGTSGFYRFIPTQKGKLGEGGRLQMLAVRGRPGYQTSTGQAQGTRLPVAWVEIPDPDPAGAEADSLAVYKQGTERGGATFSRLEGAWWADDSVYFHATSGGDARLGQVWRYTPDQGGDGGELVLVFESTSAEMLNAPDNITVSPRGGIVICEDNAASRLRGLTRDGRIFELAQNIRDGREFAGACFSPDGKTLFVNTQGDTGPRGSGALGRTYAIWGPWERGAL